ncbi:MAG: phosphatase [Leifsonia xyli]|jgi:protein-tyrosine-phosphatase|nr:MAG: phosphatase [Leifsonia xyli]
MTISSDRGLPGLAYPEASLHDIAVELTTSYEGVFNAETVQRYVLESYTALVRTSSVKSHLVTQTARFAKERLTALAQAQGSLMKDRPEVLFVCEHNAGRSQLAAALTAKLSKGSVHVRSAGSLPRSEIDPVVRTVADEFGLDLSTEFPKPLTDDIVQAADVVITMGCGDACPIYPSKRYIDWDLDDPSGASLEQARRIRDQIAMQVEALLAEFAERQPSADR